MKRLLVAVVSLGVVALCDARSLAQGRGPRGEEQEAVRNGWLLSLAEGKAQALKTGKPLMVVLRCVP